MLHHVDGVILLDISKDPCALKTLRTTIPQHSVTSQKILFFCNTAMKTSNHKQATWRLQVFMMMMMMIIKIHTVRS
jgi:hypothetical protein